MSDFILRIYNGKGDLWHKEAGAEGDLREAGARFTTVPGQLSWTANLHDSRGVRVATCKRGKWRAERQNGGEAMMPVTHFTEGL